MFGSTHNKLVCFGSFIQYLVVGAVIFVELPIVLFCWTEGWTAFEAFYFAITSLSAVGLGDFTPSFKSQEQLPAGKNEISRSNFDEFSLKFCLELVELYRIGAFLWLFLGMPFMGSILEILLYELRRNVPLLSRLLPARYSTLRGIKIDFGQNFFQG